ncbi:MAG: hypothetical protein GF364_09325 [Candidatus Lokiarchaeota archaeon]|nr:hypothetical protein [Candidatus Lokiarchaeota archaeon]
MKKLKRVRVCFNCLEYITIDYDKYHLKEKLFNREHEKHPLATIEVYDLVNIKNFECVDETYTNWAQYLMISNYLKLKSDDF